MKHYLQDSEAKLPSFSIKKRLMISVVILLTLFSSISLFVTYYFAKHEIEEIYDAHLGQSAKILLLFSTLNDSERTSLTPHQLFNEWMQLIRTQTKEDAQYLQFGHPYEQNFLFQFYQAGELIWSSNQSIPALRHDPNFSGFSDITIENATWRFFQLHLPDTFIPNHSDTTVPNVHADYIIVAEKQSIRDEMINEIAISSALPHLVLIPCLVLLVIWLIDRNFKPIQALRIAISQRNANKLDQIYISQSTEELSPLVETLNRLLLELNDAREREKRFTQMAAHELKTPLTILRLNAENALQSESESVLKQALNNILQGIDRTDRLMHQLLTLAKLESLQGIDLVEIEITHIIKHELAELAPFALANDQSLAFEGSPVKLYGDELLLGTLFRNLIDNAIRYSGKGSDITVEVKCERNEIHVLISDNGPDLSVETRHKLFDNFYRENTQRGDGAGLGMSITRFIAQLHQGSVTLQPRQEDWNRFLVRFELSNAEDVNH